MRPTIETDLSEVLILARPCRRMFDFAPSPPRNLPGRMVPVVWTRSARFPEYAAHHSRASAPFQSARESPGKASRMTTRPSIAASRRDPLPQGSIVERVEVDDGESRIVGRKDVLEQAVLTNGPVPGVRSLVRKWRTRKERCRTSYSASSGTGTPISNRKTSIRDGLAYEGLPATFALCAAREWRWATASDIRLHLPHRLWSSKMTSHTRARMRRQRATAHSALAYASWQTTS
jgi:hypothetical protein